jgi:hypothetical protein
MVLCLASDRAQASIALNFIRGHFAANRLAAMITRQTDDGMELDCGVDIVVQTSDRGCGDSDEPLVDLQLAAKHLTAKLPHVRLLDHAKTNAQFAALQRKAVSGGDDKVAHRPGGATSWR